MLHIICSRIHMGHYKWKFLVRLVEKCILSKGSQEGISWAKVSMEDCMYVIHCRYGETGCWSEQGGHGGATKQHFLKIREERDKSSSAGLCIWGALVEISVGWAELEKWGNMGVNSWSASRIRKRQKSAENLDLLTRICRDLWAAGLKTISEPVNLWECLCSPLEQSEMEKRSVPRPSFMWVEVL